jgi:menaquinone-dependent protoporphyrinogen oxidase
MTASKPLPRTLVSAASRHGSTAEIAEHIAKRISSHGVPVTLVGAEDLWRVSGYRAVVIGSAIYEGAWLPSARYATGLAVKAKPRPDVWLFSTGTQGNREVKIPRELHEIAWSTGARDHRLFSGVLNKRHLEFAERARSLRSPEGDFRDWSAIEAWADQIAATLVPAEAPLMPREPDRPVKLAASPSDIVSRAR